MLAAPLGPVQRRALRVGIEQDDVLPAQGQFAGDMRGQGGLAHPAFLVEQGEGQAVSPRPNSPDQGLSTAGGLPNNKLELLS